MKDRSPWMEFHSSLPSHRKVWTFADVLGVDRITAIGHITCLWLWALEQAQDGDLSEFPYSAISHACGYKKKPSHFIDSLATADLVEWRDSKLILHDWDLYTAPLMEKRRKDRERKSNGGSAGVPVETPARVERHSQQSTVNSTLTTTTTTTARERYFRAFGHEGTEDQLSSLESYIETHPPECVTWVFSEIAGSQRPGYGLARFLFNECGLGHKPHGPRVKEKSSAAHTRTGQGHPAATGGRQVRRTSDFD